ncbi:MAG: hypothetical protein ACR2G4_01915 [Pyrinomonadaceae bacterium]
MDTNQKKAIGKTVGACCVAIGLIYLSFFIFSRDHTPPLGAFLSVVVGIILLTLSKRR